MMMMIHELALITCSMCVCTREFCLACSRMLASVPLSKCDDIHAYTYPDRYVYVYPGGPILCIHSLNRVLISYFSSLFSSSCSSASPISTLYSLLVYWWYTIGLLYTYKYHIWSLCVRYLPFWNRRADMSSSYADLQVKQAPA